MLGGGLAALGDWLLAPAREAVRSHCHTVDLSEVQIVQAALGLDAGMVGAALWASQQRSASEPQPIVSEKETTLE